MTHELKTHPEYFVATLLGEKNFEVRKDDRNYQRGDELLLKEYNPITEEYTGRMLQRRITYILRGGIFGIEKGYCVMNIEKL
ncbi:ASCH/PUA domain-containing protein [uncultured Chryseobacterium sp.]|uniref:ASCH/PUA domain-containing protein n=1 Tax=uncultured Chryseobacterium sp. TaxID=259322 RepID=UPI0025F6EA35|nr:ASCH/PUA domain-containing protein [uncultured Chryseobacterium sp.]